MIGVQVEKFAQSNGPLAINECPATTFPPDADECQLHGVCLLQLRCRFLRF